jgi:flagellar capping protein FliD
MDLEDDNIKLANERIERQEDHLKKYEDKLKKKFAAMEQAISGAKAQRSWMNQQMGTSDDKK